MCVGVCGFVCLCWGGGGGSEERLSNKLPPR